MDFIIITGMSGAGKSRAVDALEDIGFFCVDNIPPKLIRTFAQLILQSQEKRDKVAVVTDIRAGNFFDDFLESLDELKAMGCDYKLLFIEASNEIIRRRYKETRRKHPLSDQAKGSIDDAINAERAILAPARQRADYIVDSSQYTTTQFRERIAGMFLEDSARIMQIHCVSFGFKYGIPNESDLVFDVRCLPNPFYVDELKGHTGLEAPVRDFVMKWPQAQGLVPKLMSLVDYLVPLYRNEGKSQLVIAVGCTGGRHRSVVFAELLSEHFAQQGLRVSIQHRDIKNSLGPAVFYTFLFDLWRGIGNASMSFSSQVKAELASVENTPCCMHAQTYGLLLFSRAFSFAEISMQTDTEQIARMYHGGIQREAGVEASLTQSASGKFKVYVRTAAQRQQVMAAFGHEKGELALRLNRANLTGDCCMAALLRGAFLACGTLTDPEKDYHLEFVVPYRYISRDLAKLLNELSLAPKQLERKGSHVVYCKDSGQIEEILTLMGAQNAALELMGIKMYKDMRNNINRKTNFETANISRTANAAAEQVYAIEAILEHAGVESLPEELKEIALLRLENPEMSLRELGEALSEPISRSGVNHRLRRLVSIAQETAPGLFEQKKTEKDG